jgi:cell division protein ZapA (FtsZ GTPase activity inhibitor)
MNTEKKQYKVSIFGENYVLVSDEASDTFFKSVEFVDSLMKEMSEKSRITDVKKLAVLVALQAASSMFRYERNLESANCSVSDLIHKLDKELKLTI